MRRHPDDPTAPAEPPMTPMIDIVFQLLIFFLLTMKFVAQEGVLLSHLPKGHVSGDDIVLDEVRITLCAGGDVKKHREDRGAHEAQPQDGRRVELWVEGERIAVLPRTEDEPAAANAPAYRTAADRAARLLDALPETAVVKIDADSGVPYEHVLGTLNALKRHRLDRRVEFAANPKLAALIGR